MLEEIQANHVGGKPAAASLSEQEREETDQEQAGTRAEGKERSRISRGHGGMHRSFSLTVAKGESPIVKDSARWGQDMEDTGRKKGE